MHMMYTCCDYIYVLRTASIHAAVENLPAQSGLPTGFPIRESKECIAYRISEVILHLENNSPSNATIFRSEDDAYVIYQNNIERLSTKYL